uniref:N-acetyltransferase domain-containing protein n=1 Tax=Haemonchus placei TaxID=6290 RepID=A0A0N4WLQ3_HAEPC
LLRFMIVSLHNERGLGRLFLRKYRLHALHSTSPCSLRLHSEVFVVLQLTH